MANRWVSLNAWRSTGHILPLCVCGSEQISLNCIYVLLNTKSISMMNTQLDPISVFPFGFDLQALNVSRDRSPAIDSLRLRRQYVDDTLRISSQKICTVKRTCVYCDFK